MLYVLDAPNLEVRELNDGNVALRVMGRLAVMPKVSILDEGINDVRGLNARMEKLAASRREGRTVASS